MPKIEQEFFRDCGNAVVHFVREYTIPDGFMLVIMMRNCVNSDEELQQIANDAVSNGTPAVLVATGEVTRATLMIESVVDVLHKLERFAPEDLEQHKKVLQSTPPDRFPYLFMAKTGDGSFMSITGKLGLKRDD